MKKLVPFKKDISFDTNIDEINSISLEYEIETKKDNLIAGKFIVSGDYHMTNISENLDLFNYELPFNINIDKKYNIDESEIDINDFYYEIINNKILSINIELLVENIEEREVDEEMERCIEKEDKIEEVLENKQEKVLEEAKNNENMPSLFDNLENNETYSVYKIHIVNENDTIESIMMDYTIKKEDLENYNNIQDIKIGDKIIIPANEN